MDVMLRKEIELSQLKVERHAHTIQRTTNKVKTTNDYLCVRGVHKSTFSHQWGHRSSQG